MILKETVKIRNLLEDIIKEFECYQGQICISTLSFRKKLQAPILATIKNLERQIE